MRAQKLVIEGQIEKVKAETEKAKAAQADMESQVVRNEALLADAERGFEPADRIARQGICRRGYRTRPRARRATHRPPR